MCVCSESGLCGKCWSPRDRVKREVDPSCRLICGNGLGDLSKFDGNYIVELMTKVFLHYYIIMGVLFCGKFGIDFC